MIKKVCVIGAGSWGTALALLLHKKNHEVTIWCWQEDEKNQMQQLRENKRCLPGITIPNSIKLTTDLKKAISNKDVIVLAVPSEFMRINLENIKPYIKKDQMIVNVSKGLEHETLYRLSEVIESVLPDQPVAVLTGPSHAEEVAREMPTTCTISSKYQQVAEAGQELFMTPTFRVYTNPDLVGVELGGALKNVIALAAGISAGLGLGDNAKAALMTRGMTEIARLGVCMGANLQTFRGLSGIGDLIVTCTSQHSRNRRAGELIGKGCSLQKALEHVNMVVEGVHTAKVAYRLSKKYDVEMPIIHEIYRVLFEDKRPIDAVNDLMIRDKKQEHSQEDLIEIERVNWKL